MTNIVDPGELSAKSVKKNSFHNLASYIEIGSN